MRTLGLSSLALLGSMSGCATPPSVLPRADEPLAGFVIVGSQAVLRTSSGVEVRLQPDSQAAGYTFRVVRDGPQVIEIATHLADAAHCDPALSWYRPGSVFDGDLDLHFEVSRSDLVPVLAREVSRTFEDGTGFTLAPGSQVSGSSPPFQVGAHGIEVDLQPGDVGLAFQPPEPSSGSSLAEMVGYVKPMKSFDFGPQQLTELEDFYSVRPEPTPDAVHVDSSPDQAPSGAPVYSVDVQHDVAVVAVAHACTQLRLRVPASEFEAFRPLGGLMGTLGPPTGPPPTVEVGPGSQLVWQDGTFAGEVVNALRVAIIPGTRCFDAPSAPSGLALPRVCVAPDEALTPVDG